MSRKQKLQSQIDNCFNVKRLSFLIDKLNELNEYTLWCKSKGVEPIGI